ncbi:MAG: hypothetical protein K2M94_01105 [Paramuribaculum sp.]|nr:hypothetical protein [Paramuribaculum sp.]
MNIRRLLSTIIAAVVALVQINASQEFIRHRQECFKAVPSSPGQIIFLGNSITNFHCWAEAFNHPADKNIDEALISNRGISDERAYHWKHNVQALLDGTHKPDKIFIGIGTNDLNVGIPAETVVNDIRTIIRQIQITSPQTEIILQSILPRRGAINDRVMYTNPLLESMAAEMGVKFVNLTEIMAQIPNNSDWAFDGLHPSGLGYRNWCRHIAPTVGLECTYTDAPHRTDGFGGVAGVRAGQYGMMPVGKEDILIIGDSWTDDVQWHELLGNHNVKNRSICSGNLSKEKFKLLVDRILKANKQQECPRAIVLCWGAILTGEDINNDSVKSDYEEIISYVKSIAPDARIIISQTPEVNDDKAKVNAEIMKITSAPIINLEAAGMTSDTADDWNMNAGLGAKGVLKAAQAAGEVLNADLGDGTVRIVSDEEFEACYTNRNHRIEVAKCYNSLYQHRLAGNNDITGALAQIEDILSNDTVTEAQVNKAKNLRDSLMEKLIFMPDTDKRYKISIPRDLETNRASTIAIGSSSDSIIVTDNKLTPTISTDAELWSFRLRNDRTYDIMNHEGYYLTAGDRLTLTKISPATGWVIGSGSMETGTYTLRCNDAFINYDDTAYQIICGNIYRMNCELYITDMPVK